jgi:hypothetical protein
MSLDNQRFGTKTGGSLLLDARHHDSGPTCSLVVATSCRGCAGAVLICRESGSSVAGHCVKKKVLGCDDKEVGSRIQSCRHWLDVDGSSLRSLPLFISKMYRLPTSLYCSAHTLRFSLLTIGRSLGQYFPWTDHSQRVVCRSQDPHHQPRPHTGTNNVWSSSLQRLCRCFLNVVLVRRAFMMGMLCRAIGSKMPVPIHDMTHEDTSPLQRKKSSFSEASCTKI